MKRYVRALTEGPTVAASRRSEDWQYHLTEQVYDRLCSCSSTKKDIVPLTTAFYNHSSKAKERGMDKREALDYILMWVLDWNGATWDYTNEEYQQWLASIK